LSDVRLTPLRKLLRRMREVTVAAAGRIYKHAFISGKLRSSLQASKHLHGLHGRRAGVFSPFSRYLLLEQRPLGSIVPTYAHAGKDGFTEKEGGGKYVCWREETADMVGNMLRPITATFNSARDASKPAMLFERRRQSAPPVTIWFIAHQKTTTLETLANCDGFAPRSGANIEHGATGGHLQHRG
jgi:hypothetical protein